MPSGPRHETQQRLPANVLDSITEGCQLIGKGWIYLYLNEAAARQGRQPREKLLGRSMLEVYPGIEQTPMFELLRQCMETRTAHHFENEFSYADGSRGWFDLRLEPVPDGVFILSLDITEQKRAEQENQLLVTAIHQAAEAVIITRSDGSIVYVNPAFEKISGYSREEALGHNPRILRSGKQDDAFYREMWKTLTSGRIWSGRIINRRRDGTLFTEETTISPVIDPEGSISNYVCVKRDVTRELSLEEQFRQSQKMEAIGQLAGGVAHDFNNLLSLIIGYSDVLLQSLPERDPMRSDVLEIHRAGERASALTRQLLTFSRKQPLNPQILDLNAVVAGMEEMLRRLIGEQIELVVNLASSLASVRADAGQIEQVILNLCVNARDAMPKGGRLTISTTNVALDQSFREAHFESGEGPHVMLAVSDNGFGMEESVRRRVFEPFFTTKPADKGTGLGLSTVYGIVRQSGGSIWMYSEVGTGTTFKIYLPESTGSVRKVTPPSQARLQEQTGETILLVEDEPAVRKLTARFLRTSGYNVVEVANGEDAITEYEKQPERFDLVLTDVSMPRLSGTDLVTRLRAAHPELRALFMSGYIENTVTQFEDLDHQAHFIAKPFTAAELSRKVREALLEPRPPV
jgi:PAS domain S-box-containing protein